MKLSELLPFDKSYLCGWAPFCWMFELYELDTGRGGIPAAEETGAFIIPAVNMFV